MNSLMTRNFDEFFDSVMLGFGAPMNIRFNTAKTKVVVENCRVFDVYYPKVPGDKGIPEGKKSMAFSFDLRSDERTLNDEDINQAVKAILKTLKFRLDADLRS